MKKLICSICCLCLVALLCTSCFDAKVMTVEEFAAGMTAVKDDFVPTTYEKLNLNGVEKIGYVEGHILLIENDDKELLVYNVKTATTVKTYDLDEIKSYYALTVKENILYVVVTDEDGKLTSSLYNSKGTLLATENGTINEKDISDLGYGLFKFGGSIYRAENGSVNLAVNNPFFTEIPTINAATDSYYYNLSSGSIKVYNKKFELIYSKEYPGTARFNPVLLSGDKILVQWTDYLPNTEKNYDCIYSGSKLNLESVLLDVASLKEKSLNLDFLVESSVLRLDAENKNVNYSYKNFTDVLKVYEIEDKFLRYDADPITVAVNSNKCNIKFELFGDNSICEKIEPLENGSYVMTAKDGSRYLLNNNLQNVGKIDSNTLKNSANNTYIVKNGKLYDYNLNMVYDYSADNYSIAYYLNNSIIFRDNKGDHYLYTKTGNMKEITDNELIGAQDGFYILKSDASGDYKIYNEDGDRIGGTIQADNMVPVSMYDDGCLLLFKLDDEIVFYRLIK